jgi:SAM-dependent methyltransferase
MPLDDPETVKAQYAREDNLRARQRMYQEVSGPHPHDVLWQTLVEWKPHRVLEVGGGPGELAERMQNELGAEVSFVDISPRMVELARERGVDAQVGDVQSLPFEDGSFDTVVAAWMLYHVPDLDRGLAEIARVLRPGGRLVAATNSITHLLELRELVGSGLSSITFSRESGDELLDRHFAAVRREDIDGRLRFAGRADVEEYVRASISMSPFVANLPAEIDEPFFARRANSVFVAEKTA